MVFCKGFFLVRNAQGHTEPQENKANKTQGHGTKCYETKAKPGTEAQLFLQRTREGRTRSVTITPLQKKPVLLSNKSLES